MPAQVMPMLATLTKELVNDTAYLYELKWDGYRIMAFVQKSRVRLDSRSGKDYTSRYPLVVKALKALKHQAVLDGEMVVLNENGLPDFGKVQLYNGHTTPITYYLFDVIWLDGYDLTSLPLTARKEILTALIGDQPILRISESFDDGQALLELVKEQGIEGLVAKRKDSAYLPDDRSRNWLKTPIKKRQEFVIGGWAESDKSRSFRSLLFGAYNEQGQFEWIGRSGGGYKEKEMPGILKELKKREVKGSPFINPVLDTKGAVIHWVKPQLVANFEFSEWTASGRIRKPATFLGFRKDKAPKQVVREVPLETMQARAVEEVDAPTAVRTKKVNTSPKRPLKTSTGSNWPEVEGQNMEDATSFKLSDCTIELFNVDRTIWKGITKADLIQYYHRVAPYLLLHIKDRPQSLHIKLHGPQAPGLYIKDMEGRQPMCATIFTDKRRHQVAGKRNQIDYLVCNNEATLLWLINMGCIDINPWNSRMKTPDEPDYLVIDLDPSEEKPTAKGLNRLRNTAMAAKEFCAEHQLKTLVKTSGKTGIHFLIPCAGFTTPAARALAERICGEIQQLVPDDSTIVVNKGSRQGKVFVDFSQNDYADTIAAPYSVRPYKEPLVSTPLNLREINMHLYPHDFTIKEVLRRLSKKGDLFEDLLDKKVAIANTRRLQTMQIE